MIKIDHHDLYVIFLPNAMFNSITNYELGFISHKVYDLDIWCDNLINTPKPYSM